MINKFFKQLNNKRTQSIALLCIVLLNLCSFWLYKQHQGELEAKQIEFETLSQTNEEIREISKRALYLGITKYLEDACKDKTLLLTTVTDKYDYTLSDFVRALKEAEYDKNKAILIYFAGHGSQIDEISAESDEFYKKRILLEFDRQDNLISENTYLNEKARLFDFYSNRILSLNTNFAEKVQDSNIALLMSNSGVNDLLKRMDGILQNLRDSANKIAQTRPSFLEKWIPIFIGFLSLIVALLTFLITLIKTVSELISTWRKDARETFEFSFRKKELENIVVIPSTSDVERIVSSHKK